MRGLHFRKQLQTLPAHRKINIIKQSNKTMIATNLKQSRHLLELGLSASTADMCWCNSHDVDRWFLIPRTQGEVKDSLLEQDLDEVEIIPAWSLSTLLEVMPNNDYWEIYLCQAQDGKWQSVWNDCEISNGESKDFIADTPIDASYEMVCWLLAQGYIKKGGQDDK